MPVDLDTVIQDNATGPVEASVDGQTVKRHPLRDQVEADRYLCSKKAAKAKVLGVRVAKLAPPGAP